MNPKIPIIAIIGPTGTGKTQLSIRLAKDIGGEVISVDSIQVYRDATIMSGAATPQEMSGITHHLLNYLNVSEEPDNLIPMAIQAIKMIHQRGKIPILCGGSMSLTEPLLFHPFVEQQDLLVMCLNSRMDKLGVLTDRRIDGMVADGLKNEVKRLYELEKKNNHTSTTARGAWKSIGYPELRVYCEEEDPDKSEALFKQGVKVMKEHTQVYFRMQLDKLWCSTLPRLFQKQREFCIFNVENKETFEHDVEEPAIHKCNKWLCHTSDFSYNPLQAIVV